MINKYGFCESAMRRVERVQECPHDKLRETVSKLNTAEEETITAGIQAAVTAYLAEIVFQQDYVSFARITDRILDVEGVLDLENLTVNGGTGNVAVGERECAVLGEVTLSYA